MHKCEHSKPISKFCMSEHCQSKQSGGCQDCMRKYHNHIGQVSFLNQDDIKAIVRKFQIEPNYRPKSRPLQESIFNFFTHIKTNLASNLDIVCKNLINQIGYPYLHRNATLNCYKRLKNKEYRKVTQKQLKQLYEDYRNSNIDDIIKQQKQIYGQAVAKMQQTLQQVARNVKEIFQNLSLMTSITKSALSVYDGAFYMKVSEVFKQIKKYPDVSFPKAQSFKEKSSDQANKFDQKFLQKQTSQNQQTTERKKLNRDVSLDRHIRVQNKLRQEIQKKANLKIQSPSKNKATSKNEKNMQMNNNFLQSKELSKVAKQKQKQVQKGGKKTKKYSFELKAQEIMIRPPSALPNDSNFSQKEEEILERKKKLLDLMNSKPAKRQDSTSKTSITDSKKDISTPVRQKTFNNQIDMGDYLKDTLSPQNYLINREFRTPSSNFKNQKQQTSFGGRYIGFRESLSSKRAKTAYEEQDQCSQHKKQTRNQTVTSSQTQTQHLFNAKIHIPFEDNKLEDEFQIKQESRHKCIVVPEVNIDMKKQMIVSSEECQSPLLMKKKEIQNFSALMKLAESKFLGQQEQQLCKSRAEGSQQEKSFIKINKILEQSNQKEKNLALSDFKSSSGQQTLKQHQSVQINQNEQKSLALLLHSLKLPAPQAIIQLQKSLAYSSNNLSAGQYLSYLYLQAQKPQECLKLCNDLLKSISSSESNDLALRLNINKSAALNHLGRYSQCITFLQRCLRHRHNDILYKNLADAYYSIGILQKAIYNYEHAILQNSSNTQAHYNLAVCHYQQQNYHNASIYIDKALKHQPAHEVYRQMRKYIDQKIFANLPR